jgi:TonB family protein
MNLVNWLLCIRIIGSTILVQAQTTWYCPVEIMPELLTGGGGAAIAAAIQRQLIYPTEAKQAHITGRVFIRFTITPSGRVQNIFVVKSFRSDCGLAVVNAVWLLPRFKPRLKKYGDLRYVAPITFRIEGSRPIGQPSFREYRQVHRKLVRHLNSTP